MNLGTTLILIVLITVSAFGAIFVKYQNRILNIEVSKNERILFETSERYRELLEQKVNLTDSKLQKSGLGEALGMSLPSKERILIMNLNN
jgi:cell division protein FtsL|tara:strand:+ start:54 stop:323 length:270 start_codon:yes stop_codon:yes gene_type:complete